MVRVGVGERYYPCIAMGKCCFDSCCCPFLPVVAHLDLLVVINYCDMRGCKQTKYVRASAKYNESKQ